MLYLFSKPKKRPLYAETALYNNRTLTAHWLKLVTSFNQCAVSVRLDRSKVGGGAGFPQNFVIEDPNEGESAREREREK